MLGLLIFVTPGFAQTSDDSQICGVCTNPPAAATTDTTGSQASSSAQSTSDAFNTWRHNCEDSCGKNLAQSNADAKAAFIKNEQAAIQNVATVQAPSAQAVLPPLSTTGTTGATGITGTTGLGSSQTTGAQNGGAQSIAPQPYYIPPAATGTTGATGTTKTTNDSTKKRKSLYE